jgi:hypothetical protein
MQATTSPGDEREAFTAWRAHYINTVSGLHPTAWDAWQARAARSTVQQVGAEPSQSGSAGEAEGFEAWAQTILGDNPTWRESGDGELARQAWNAALSRQAPAAPVGANPLGPQPWDDLGKKLFFASMLARKRSIERAHMDWDNWEGDFMSKDEWRKTAELFAVPTPADPQALLGWTRYEKARKLNPAQWAELHQRNLRGENFDDMIDALPATTQPAQQDTDQQDEGCIRKALSNALAKCDVPNAYRLAIFDEFMPRWRRLATPPAEKQAAPSGEDNHG